MSGNMEGDIVALDDLHLNVIVGVNPGERVTRQPVVFSLQMFCNLSQAGVSDDVAHTVNYASVAKLIQRFCDRCHAFTIEALASGVVREILLSTVAGRLRAITLTVRKPAALKCKAIPSVTITRTKIWAESLLLNKISQTDCIVIEEPTTEVATTPENVYLALGSNLGHRVRNITTAIDVLQRPAVDLLTESVSTEMPYLRLLATSHLYETPPAYVLHQPAFLNCVVKVSEFTYAVVDFVESLVVCSSTGSHQSDTYILVITPKTGRRFCWSHANISVWAAHRGC
jgi:dihydroneopterin aldolase/2-amino-4-hydroxy-6-hydroxymethyldihydropteridine diphosphokinase/dihydropteroate synthase